MAGIDNELDTLMGVLNEIQKGVGGKDKDKKKGEGGKIDKFMDLKQAMIGRMTEVRELHALTKNKGGGEMQPKEVIATNQQIREHMRQLNEDLKELERLYLKEKSKRKSKLNPEEMEMRGNMVTQMQNEVQELKELALSGYVRGIQGNRIGLVGMEESEAFKGPLAGAVSMNTDMTEDNRAQMQQIMARDKELDDRYLNQIEKGVDDLKDLALRANEAVRTSEVMLGNLEQKIIDVQDHLDRVNKKMKNTLDQVGRSSDKICIDIICIIILLGMTGVIYNMIRNTR